MLASLHLSTKGNLCRKAEEGALSMRSKGHRRTCLILYEKNTTGGKLVPVGTNISHQGTGMAAQEEHMLNKALHKHHKKSFHWSASLYNL